ncbi:uncharacterized protein LOC102808577 [Saccoglossus kowalevskii]
MARSWGEVLLWLFLGLLFPICESSLIRLRPNEEYIYQYEAKTQLDNVGVFKTNAKIGISLLEDEGNGQHCRLHVISIMQVLDHDTPKGEVLPHSRGWHMTKWFSFVMTYHGEVTAVYYPETENMEVLTFKKMFVGLFTSKLHTSDELLKAGKDWTYKVNETGHEGEHESTYTATPTTDGIVFRRQKHGHVVYNAKATHEKEILYHSDLQLPHSIHIEESFSAPRKASPGYDMYAGVPGDKKKKEENERHQYDLPEMAGTSTGDLQYISTKALRFPHNATVTSPNNLISDSIQILMYDKPPLPLEEIDKQIKGNMSCVWENKIIESVEKSTCFNNLVHLLPRLSAINLTIIAERYITDDVTSEKEFEYRSIMIDALGAIATETSQLLLTEMILLSDNPNPDLIYRCLVHFVALKVPPPTKFINLLETIAFRNKFVFPVILPWAAQQIEDAIKAAAQAVKKLFKSPRTAITDIAKSVYKIKAAIAGVFEAKNRIEEACFFLDDQRPYWFDLDDEISGIWEDILNAKDKLEDALDWITEGVSAEDNKFEHFTGVSLSTVRQQIIDEIIGDFDDLLAPLTIVQKISEPFVLAYESFTGTIEDIKEGYEGIKRAYDEAKTLINEIFGPKMGKKFPRTIAYSSCGEGAYSNTNQNTLPGIDLEAQEGEELTAPFNGVITSSGGNQVTMVIDGGELKDTEIIIYYVELHSNVDGTHVSISIQIHTNSKKFEGNWKVKV